MGKIHKKALALCAPFFVIAVFALLFPFVGSITGNELGYSLLVFYLAFPLSGALACFGLAYYGTKLFWLGPICAAAIPILVEFLVFNVFDFSPFGFLALVPALVGMGIGVLVRRRA